ncbi:hypothetical protein IT570_03115 [Candidatus Sumerlaeota bacterium]|nr:hypothetical protein [Candidatus Sumerlaeota bacterium]
MNHLQAYRPQCSKQLQVLIGESLRKNHRVAWLDIGALAPLLVGRSDPFRAGSDGENDTMIEGSNLLKMVQEKLAEKEEVIHEQQRQIEELQKSLESQGDGTGESEAVIREQMEQLLEMTEKLEKAEAKAKEDEQALQEKEEVILEQMQQLMDLTEKLEDLQKRAAAWAENQKEFEALQKQLQDLLGKS